MSHYCSADYCIKYILFVNKVGDMKNKFICKFKQ